jgi:hypothetical protein
MGQPLEYVPGERGEVDPSDEETRDMGRRLGQLTLAVPCVLGALGLLAATVVIVSIKRAQQRREGHPALAELLANGRRWEHDVRHHRGALERLGRELQHERRELEQHRRHALIGLMHR